MASREAWSWSSSAARRPDCQDGSRMPTARTGTRIASRTKASGEISISDTHAQRLRVLPLHPTFQRQREVPRGSQFSDSRLLRRGRRVVFRGDGPKRPATAGRWPPRPEGEPHVCVASPPAGAVRRVINVLDQDNVRFSPADQQPDAASDAAVRLAGASCAFRRNPRRVSAVS
jgi:hypothetical protein